MSLISFDFRFPYFFHYVKSMVGISSFPQIPKFFVLHCLLQHLSIWYLLPRNRRGGRGLLPLLRFVSYLNFVYTSVGEKERGTGR